MSETVKTPSAIADHTRISYTSFQDYRTRAQLDPHGFWADQARQRLDWISDFTITQTGSFDLDARIAWFPDGTLNVSANCLDRHLKDKGDKNAIIWVGDEPGEERIITYRQLAQDVNRWANMLKAHGVKKGDPVILYMPMIPEAAMAMLACARIGAIHSAVFAGFSAQALHDRIHDSGAKIIITTDEGKRGGKTIPLKATVDDAVQGIDHVQHVLVVRHTQNDISMIADRDIDTHAFLSTMNSDCPYEALSAEDPLFILYTSGSTGKPKGLVHTQAGYLLYAATTFETLFDYRDDDIYFCTADIGWITGHSYIVYGPLACGATVLMYEGIPTYPEADRFWKIIDQYKVSIFYTAPTALRALMQLGDTGLDTTSRSSLRILGSVGEPINPEAWRWYFNKVGKQSCAIVDTWWQTETGGHLIAPPPSSPDMKPGWAMQPFWGIDPVLIDAQNNIVTGAGEGGLFIAKPWPGMARTIYNDHARFVETYFSQYKGLYCSGDGANRDESGFIQITGRVDDVINVSGHRFGTAEIESALVAHPHVAEAAVIGREHAIKGMAIYAYITLKQGTVADDALKKELNNHVRKEIGAIAGLDWIQWAPALPKTRSGKIMRRILRKIAENQLDSLGDTSTLADPAVIDHLIAHRVD
jgi:acetyl-CoA synthetase